MTAPRPPAPEILHRPIDRATFLRGLALAGLGTVAGPHLFAQEAHAAPAADISPLSLRFSIVDQFRPFDLIAEDFVQVRQRFGGGVASRLQAVEPAEGAAATAQVEGESLTLAAEGAFTSLFRTGARPLAPFATVIVDVASAPRSSGGEAAVLVGLVGSGSDYVVASFDAGADPAAGTVSIDVSVGGTRTRAASAPADLSGGPLRLAFVVNENYATALIGRTDDWVPVVQSRVTELVDLRDPAVLRTYSYGFGGSGDGASVTLDGFEAGYFGQAGLRDLHAVQYADGTPYIRDGRLYFTATNAGLSFFQAAHYAVWTLDLADTSRVEQVANIFFARDGLVLGDHAGQIVIDDDGSYLVAVSSWGDFAFAGVSVRWLRTRERVLEGVHVLASERLPLPTDVSSWDPSLTRIDGTWYVAFVESPYQDPVRGFDFRPALARSAPGGPVTELTRVGADLTRGETEGVILQKIGDVWYLLASDGDDRIYRVYDLEVRFLGQLDAPYGTNIPHPQIVPVTERGRTHYLLITFNGTQYYEPVLGYGTHGDVIVMRAAQERNGREFPRRRGGGA